MCGVTPGGRASEPPIYASGFGRFCGWSFVTAVNSSDMSFRLRLLPDRDILSAMPLTSENDYATNITDGDSRRAVEGDRFRVRRSHLLTWVGLAIALFFAGVALGDSDSVRAADADGVLFGAYAQPRGGQSDVSAVQALESSPGVTLPMVREHSYSSAPRPSQSQIDWRPAP